MIRSLSFFPTFLLALVLCAAAHAQTALKVKVFPGAQALSLIAGTSQGIFEKHGLDVDIARGSGSVAAAQAIGEARFDFGMCSPSAAILQTIRGLPTVALAACAYDATMGIGVLNDGPIKTSLSGPVL